MEIDIINKIRNKYSGLTTEVGKVAVPMMIGFILLGFMGLTIALGLTVGIPFMIGMVAPASTGGRKSWGELSNTQKGALGGTLILALPFLAMLFFLLLFLGVSLYIDLLFIIPITLIVIYLILNKGVKPSDVRTDKGFLYRMFSSKVTGAIGLIAIIVILLFATYGYTSEQPSISRAGDGAVVSGLTGDFENGTVPVDPVANTTLYIQVIDDFFVQAGDGSPIVANPEAFTTAVDNGTQTMDMQAVDGDYPLEFTKVTIFAYDIISGESRNMVNYTDANGIVGFKGMMEGEWFFSAERTLYRAFNGNFTLTEEFIEREYLTYLDGVAEPDVTVHMTPIMYKIRLSYNIIQTEEFTQATYEESAEFLYEQSGYQGTLEEYDEYVGKLLIHDSKFNFTVSVTGEMLGSISRGDLQESTRQADWYGWTTIDLGTGNQMFAIKQSIMSMYNSIWSTLNSITYGATGLFGTYRRYYIDEAIEEEWAKYQGHRYSIDIAEDGAGESVYIATLPTNNTIQNKTFWNAGSPVTMRVSTLSYREMEFIAFSPKDVSENNTLYLGFTFYTYYSLTDLWLLGEESAYFPQDSVFTGLEYQSNDWWDAYYDAFDVVESDDIGDFMRVDQFLITINDERPTQTAQDFHLGKEGDFP